MAENDPRDLPVPELLAMADQVLSQRKGAKVFFKFTCEACGARQTFTTPNKWYTSGQCEECGHVTALTRGGMLVHLIRTGGPDGTTDGTGQDGTPGDGVGHGDTGQGEGGV